MATMQALVLTQIVHDPAVTSASRAYTNTNGWYVGPPEPLSHSLDVGRQRGMAAVPVAPDAARGSRSRWRMGHLGRAGSACDGLDSLRHRSAHSRRPSA